MKISPKFTACFFLAAAYVTVCGVIASFICFDFEMTKDLSLFYKDIIGSSVFSFVLYLGVTVKNRS